MWAWMPLTVSLPVRLPRRPFLIMSPSFSTEVGSPTMQKSSFSPRFSSCSQTTTVPSTLGPSSSLVIRKAMSDVRVRVLRQEFFDRHGKRRDRRLHVGGAAAIQQAVAVAGHEGIAGPLFQRAGGHDVGVAGEDQRAAGGRGRGAWPRDW
jgi:hypothetical protein